MAPRPRRRCARLRDARPRRVAPNSLRAKAAAERSQTQKKVIVFSIAIAIVAVIACAGAILITTAGEGLGRASRANPVVAHDRERCKMATLSRRISRHRRTTRKTVLPLPIRPRTPKTNRRAPIPLWPTVARRPARPTQAKRLTVHSRTREARRATPRRNGHGRQ